MLHQHDDWLVNELKRLFCLSKFGWLMPLLWNTISDHTALLVELQVACPQLLSPAVVNSALPGPFPFFKGALHSGANVLVLQTSSLWQYSQMEGVNVKLDIITILSLVWSSSDVLCRCQGAVDLNSFVGRSKRLTE